MIGPTEKPEALEFYSSLLIRALEDAAESCGLRSSSIDRDKSTIVDRIRDQGLSFLTKALPSLGKHLDKALGSDTPFSSCDGFQTSQKTGFPLLFQSFWALIFDAEGLAVPACEGGAYRRAQAVRAVRQVCYLLYKLEGAHTRESELQTIRDFRETDALLPEPDAERHLEPKVRRALENAAVLVWYVLRDVNLANITPGHGPGSLATKEKPPEKMKFRRIHEKLEREYPFTDYFFLNYSHLVECLERLDDLEEVSISKAKVVLVPKDSRGPRLISMEPLEHQWIQQGQMRALVRAIESERSPSCGYVNFTSQEINRQLALSSSRGGDDFVTLDMKEASDRVSLWLVRKLMPGHIIRYIEASRSTHTELPSGECIELRKFAPMGSSVCFPTEALIFWALSIGSLVDVIGSKSLRDLPPVYVFGDDIIMRKCDYGTVRPIFEALDLRFNDGKCCTGRFFKESCGMDAFLGFPVSPIRVKAPWSSRMSPAAILSYVSYVNSFRRQGYNGTADFLHHHCSKTFGSLPSVRQEGRLALAYTDYALSSETIKARLLSNCRSRYNAALQRTEIRVLTPYSPTQVVGMPDWDELFRSLVRTGPPDPFGFRERSLEPCCYPVPHQVKMRWSWIALDSVI